MYFGIMSAILTAEFCLYSDIPTYMSDKCSVLISVRSTDKLRVMTSHTFLRYELNIISKDLMVTGCQMTNSSKSVITWLWSFNIHSTVCNIRLWICIHQYMISDRKYSFISVWYQTGNNHSLVCYVRLGIFIH